MIRSRRDETWSRNCCDWSYLVCAITWHRYYLHVYTCNFYIENGDERSCHDHDEFWPWYIWWWNRRYFCMAYRPSGDGLRLETRTGLTSRTWYALHAIASAFRTLASFLDSHWSEINGFPKLALAPLSRSNTCVQMSRQWPKPSTAVALTLENGSRFSE